MIDVWVVSKCAICEEMMLYFDGRLSNSIAEPVLRQRSALLELLCRVLHVGIEPYVCHLIAS